MKTITVHSKKYGNQLALVDDCDFDMLSEFHWCLSRKITKSGGMIQYAISHQPGKHSNRIPMHRLLLGLTNRNELGDHRDGNGLNNQRSNIRKATYGENSQNKGVCRRNEAGFKGVVMNKENKFRKYCAIIISNRVRIFGGGFKTPVEAAFKWNELARQYHGEFASLNPVTATKYADGTMYVHEKKIPCRTPTREKDWIIEKVMTFVPSYRKRT